jgi:hypothetical protein
MKEGQKTEEEYFLNCMFSCFRPFIYTLGVQYPILDENNKVVLNDHESLLAGLFDFLFFSFFLSSFLSFFLSFFYFKPLVRFLFLGESPQRPLPVKDRDYIEFLDWLAPTISLEGIL